MCVGGGGCGVCGGVVCVYHIVSFTLKNTYHVSSEKDPSLTKFNVIKSWPVPAKQLSLYSMFVNITSIIFQH